MLRSGAQLLPRRGTLRTTAIFGGKLRMGWECVFPLIWEPIPMLRS